MRWSTEMLTLHWWRRKIREGIPIWEGEGVVRRGVSMSLGIQSRWVLEKIRTLVVFSYAVEYFVLSVYWVNCYLIMDPNMLYFSMIRKTVGMENSSMTIEFLRARLLAERSVSQTARQRADELAERVSSLTVHKHQNVESFFLPLHIKSVVYFTNI